MINEECGNSKFKEQLNIKLKEQLDTKTLPDNIFLRGRYITTLKNNIQATSKQNFPSRK
jgi:hypothetical protein